MQPPHKLVDDTLCGHGNTAQINNTGSKTGQANYIYELDCKNHPHAAFTGEEYNDTNSQMTTMISFSDVSGANGRQIRIASDW